MRLNDETALQLDDRLFDIDRDASRVAFATASPSASANLALRGDEAWVGGVGVVPAARRQGIGELLMRALHEEARARGVAQGLARGDRAERERVPPLREARLRRRARGGGLDARRRERAAGAARCRPAGARTRPRAAARRASPGSGRTRRSRTSTDPRGLETDAGAAVFRVTGAVQLVQIAGCGARAATTLRAPGDTSRPQPSDRRSRRGRAPRPRRDASVRQREMVARALGG